MKNLILSAISAVLATSILGTSVSAQSLSRPTQPAPSAHDPAKAPPSVSPHATTDPFKLIYRITGLLDRPSASGNPTASVLTCTNYSPVPENVRFYVYNFGGTLRRVSTATLNRLVTFTFSTREVAAFDEDLNISTGSLTQGMAQVFSTTTNIVCTTMIIDAALTTPSGIDLHMVRFNAFPGTVE